MHIRTLVAAATAWSLVAVPAGATDEGPDELGRFSAPFEEPTVAGQRTDDDCVEAAQEGDQHEGRHLSCKPAAGAMSVLSDGSILYYNTLEDTEEVETGVALEFGKRSINDQTRRLDLATMTWTQPDPVDAGANPDGYQNPLTPLHTTESYNDGSVFCTSLNHLADGRILTTGGTTYYNDPGLDESPYGVIELGGLKATRIYDAATNSWTQAGDMNHGRWYPTTVTLPDERVFVASGVARLLKPVYTGEHGEDPTDSGRNVPQTETFDPATGQWTENGPAGERSLPLYPRMHLLPNGDVYYNAGGQVFNPAGQAYDEALWNIAATYDPETQSWQDLGVPGLGTSVAPGFRGSTTSVMLPLRPDEDGGYTEAEFLTAGGILGTSPGGYAAVPFSRIDTVDTTTMSLSSRSTDDLEQPRWFGQGVLTPTGEVFMFNGASADEVVGPGTAIPVTRAEMFDPETETWTAVAEQHQPRTYHNTAALLPDGRILVGGHAPISTLYGNNTTLVPGVTSPNQGRDPSFEIYEPPYLFRGDRPEILGAPETVEHGERITLAVDDAGDIESVLLVRQTAVTHLVDGDQRAVELPILRRDGRSLIVAGPTDGAVAPAGPYLLFVNRRTDDGLVPSVAAPVDVRPGGAVVSAGQDVAASRGSAWRRPTPTPPVDLAAVEASRAADLAAAGAVAVDPAVVDHQHAAPAGEGHLHDPGHAVELAAASAPVDERGPYPRGAWLLVPAFTVATLGWGARASRRRVRVLRQRRGAVA